MQYEHNDGIRVTTRRARIVKVDDSGTQQLVDLKVLKNEKPKKVWRPVDFGFFSVPPEDTDGVVVQMGSRADRTLYFDGGHKDYRPKSRPTGSAGLFDQYGNLLQIDKDHAGVTHSSKISLQLGHGYDAKDAQSYSGPAVSIVLEGNDLTITMGDSIVKLEQNQITLTSPKVVVKSDQVHLGDDGGVLVKRCDDSCATKVYAV